MSGALFGNVGSSRNQSKNLVEFKAGKMALDGRMVNPDKRKGMVYVHQSDDSLMHFCWKDRSNGKLEDDLIIFPDDVEFKAVPQCTTGRVFILKFKTSNRKFFFWMQEAKKDKDEEYCKKVNDVLNHPPTSSRGNGSAGGVPPELAGLAEGSDIQSMLGNMSQQQLMSLLGGMGMGNLRPEASLSQDTRISSQTNSQTSAAQTPTVQTSSTTTALDNQREAVQLRDLQSILKDFSAEESKPQVDLSSAITPESMVPILADPQIQARLVDYLPDGQSLPKTEAELRSTISSPQFKQALSSFSAALASGQLGSLMGQFGLGEDVAKAATAGDIEAFIKAMQEQESKKADDDMDTS